MNRLAGTASPYLRSHADNPVDWWPWGPEPFAEARRRDVPVLVSIGYSTCHWCHVMARESFSDPVVAERLNAGFVAVKVDREEHPDVDSAYMSAAAAFTEGLGWPLTVFTTPDGRAFHAGTYFPPEPVQGHPSFTEVLVAVEDAWRSRRTEVERGAGALAEALHELATRHPAPAALDLDGVVDTLVASADPRYGGFGGAPKFPVATGLALAQDALASGRLDETRRADLAAVLERTLPAMRDGELRDPVDGGFFRYATRRDWSVPHYERMLVDNALLLRVYADADDIDTADGVVRFLTGVLADPSGALRSAQDSESRIDGRLSEGGYYALDAAARREQPAPAVDGKVLSGWNGIAIASLAGAGARHGRPEWVAAAERAADAVAGLLLDGGRLRRAALEGVPSSAVATLEDHGGLALGLLEVALAAGRPDLAVTARALVDACLEAEGTVVRAPETDPQLLASGAAATGDLSEGAAPSGPALLSRAAHLLHLLTGVARYRTAAQAAIAPYTAAATQRPLAGAGVLGAALALEEPVVQLVVVGRDPELAAAARSIRTSVTAIVDEDVAVRFAGAGFELFAGRGRVGDRAAAYLCRDFVCRLPGTDSAALFAAAQ